MATYQVSESHPPFEYGSTVKWEREGKIFIGCICGFDVVRTNKRAVIIGAPLGTVIALVEARDGKSIELPLTELELI